MAKFKVTFNRGGISDPNKEKEIQAEYFRSPYSEANGSKNVYEFYVGQRQTYSDTIVPNLIASIPADNVLIVEEIS